MNRCRYILRSLLICSACALAGSAVGDRIGHSYGEKLRSQIPTGPHDGLPELGPAFSELEGIVAGAIAGLVVGVICFRLLPAGARQRTRK
jgi:hypothetical protein